jgi:hypothetical protein
MFRKSRRSGLTKLELLILLGVIAIIVGGIVFAIGLVGGVAMGNHWVDEESALKAIQVTDSSMTDLVRLERHVWGYSHAVAMDEEGSEKNFLLDACILQNVTAIISDE